MRSRSGGMKSVSASTGRTAHGDNSAVVKVQAMECLCLLTGTRLDSAAEMDVVTAIFEPTMKL